jgi:hypothetical protein
VKPIVKVGIIAAVAAGAIFLLTRKVSASEETPVSSSSTLGATILGGVVALAKKVLPKVLGIGGAAAATTTATGAAAIPAAASVPVVVPATSAAAGAGTAGASSVGASSAAGAGAFSIGGVVAVAAFLLINIKILMGGTEPEWHRQWRESGGLAAFEKTYADANLKQAAQLFKPLPTGTYKATTKAQPEETITGTVISSEYGDVQSTGGWVGMK